MPAAAVIAAGAAPAPGSAIATPADFEAASAKDLPTLRATALATILKIPDLTTRNREVGVINKTFLAPKVGVNSTRPEVRLNVAIFMAGTQTLSSDAALQAMLTNSDAAVRYWAVCGLTSLASQEKRAGASATISALQKAAKAEPSSIVAQELIKAFKEYEDPAGTVEALNVLATKMNTTIPDIATLQAATAGLQYVATKIPDKVKAATAAANLASSAAQQAVAYEKSQADQGATLPPGYLSAVQKLVDAATQAANAAAGGGISTPVGTIPAEILLNVNGTFGTPGGKAGTLQGKLAPVPVPAMLNAGT
jgi:hypothetical protein